MTQIPQETWEKAVTITGFFEGGEVCGNFDGQLLSMGVLQHNLGQGTLQPILRQVFAEHPEMVGNFGLCELKQALDAGTEIEFARGTMNAGGKRLTSDWHRKLTALNDSTEFKTVYTGYTGEYRQQAQALCDRFKCWTERMACLAFDIAVQNWTVKGAVDSSLPYLQMLEAIALAVTAQSDRQWAADVKARKMAIVCGRDMGRGWPANMELEDEDMSEVAELKERIAKLEGMLGLGTVGKEADWKTEGEQYLRDAGYCGSQHDPREIVDVGLLGMMLKNNELVEVK